MGSTVALASSLK